MDLDERQIKIEVTGAGNAKWFLELTAAKDAPLPFRKIKTDRVDCRFENMNYGMDAVKGRFSTGPRSCAR